MKFLSQTKKILYFCSCCIVIPNFPISFEYLILYSSYYREDAFVNWQFSKNARILIKLKGLM